MVGPLQSVIFTCMFGSGVNFCLQSTRTANVLVSNRSTSEVPVTEVLETCTSTANGEGSLSHSLTLIITERCLLVSWWVGGFCVCLLGGPLLLHMFSFLCPCVPRLIQSLFGGTTGSSQRIMALSVPRPYACPHCLETFTKWGLCQGHLRQSRSCREEMGALQLASSELQAHCRAIASTESTLRVSNASLLSPPSDLAPAVTPEAPPWAPLNAVATFTTEDHTPPLPPEGEDVSNPPESRPAQSANSLLRRACQGGRLTRAELTKLDAEMPRYPSHVQDAAVVKFLSLSPNKFHRIVDKASWMSRCARFCDLTPSPCAETNALSNALAAQAVLPEELNQECWNHFQLMPSAEQERVIVGVRSSLLMNVVGADVHPANHRLSHHFLNVCHNEHMILCAEGADVPWTAPESLEWEALDGSLYQRLLQRMLFLPSSEEAVLRDMAEDRERGLRWFHEATSAVRRQGSAEISSVLHVAAAKGLVRVCARLIAEGLDVNERAGEEETTALHIAAFHGEVDVLTLLLEKAADPDVPNREGHSALFVAVTPAAGRAQCSLRRQIFRALLKRATVGLDSAERLAEDSKMYDVRNLIRFHKRLGNVHIDDGTLALLCDLQYETAIFVISLFERLVVSPEARHNTLEVKQSLASNQVEFQLQPNIVLKSIWEVNWWVWYLSVDCFGSVRIYSLCFGFRCSTCILFWRWLLCSPSGRPVGGPCQ